MTQVKPLVRGSPFTCSLLGCSRRVLAHFSILGQGSTPNIETRSTTWHWKPHAAIRSRVCAQQIGGGNPEQQSRTQRSPKRITEARRLRPNRSPWYQNVSGSISKPVHPHSSTHCWDKATAFSCESRCLHAASRVSCQSLHGAHSSMQFSHKATAFRCTYLHWPAAPFVS